MHDKFRRCEDGGELQYTLEKDTLPGHGTLLDTCPSRPSPSNAGLCWLGVTMVPLRQCFRASSSKYLSMSPGTESEVSSSGSNFLGPKRKARLSIRIKHGFDIGWRGLHLDLIGRCSYFVRHCPILPAARPQSYFSSSFAEMLHIVAVHTSIYVTDRLINEIKLAV